MISYKAIQNILGSECLNVQLSLSLHCAQSPVIFTAFLLNSLIFIHNAPHRRQDKRWLLSVLTAYWYASVYLPSCYATGFRIDLLNWAKTNYIVPALKNSAENFCKGCFTTAVLKVTFNKQVVWLLYLTYMSALYSLKMRPHKGNV